MDQYHCCGTRALDRNFFEPLVLTGEPQEATPARIDWEWNKNWYHIVALVVVWLITMAFDHIMGIVLLLTFVPFFIIFRWFKKTYRENNHPKTSNMFSNFSWSFWFLTPTAKLCTFILSFFCFNMILHAEVRRWTNHLEGIEDDDQLTQTEKDEESEAYLEEEIYDLRQNPKFHIFLILVALMGGFIAEFGKFLLAKRSIREHLRDVTLDKYVVDGILIYCTTIGLAFAVMDNIFFALIDFRQSQTVLYMMSCILLGSMQHAFCGYMIGLQLVKKHVLGRDLGTLGILQWPWLFDFLYGYAVWWLFVFIDGYGIMSVFLIFIIMLIFAALGYRISNERDELRLLLDQQSSPENEGTYSIQVPMSASIDNEINNDIAYDMSAIPVEDINISEHRGTYAKINQTGDDENGNLDEKMKEEKLELIEDSIGAPEDNMELIEDSLGVPSEETLGLTENSFGEQHPSPTEIETMINVNNTTKRLPEDNALGNDV